MTNELDERVEDLNLSAKVIDMLIKDGIFTVRDIVSKTEEEMLDIPKFTAINLHQVKKFLAFKSMRFAMIKPEAEANDETINYKNAYIRLKQSWDYEQHKIKQYNDLKMKYEDLRSDMKKVFEQNSFIIAQHKKLETNSKEYISELLGEIKFHKMQIEQLKRAFKDQRNI